MKSRLNVVLLFACALFAGFIYTVVAQEGAPAKGTTRWEHMAMRHEGANVTGEDEVAKKINQVGNDGWELVTVITSEKDGTTASTTFFFKRRK